MCNVAKNRDLFTEKMAELKSIDSEHGTFLLYTMLYSYCIFRLLYVMFGIPHRE